MTFKINELLYSNFPEELWPPNYNERDEYFKRIRSGAETALNSSVCILGLARNISKELNRTLPRIQKIGNMFKSWSGVIYENDSIDDTAQKIKSFAQEGNLTLEIFSETLNHGIHKQDRSLTRMEAMSYYRNKCIERSKIHGADFIIVLDPDLIGGFSYFGILNSLGYAGEFDMIGANSIIYDNNESKTRRLYYDSWAFRKGQWEPHKDEEINPLQFHRGEGLVRVNSCFGGLGIYPAKVFDDNLIYYSGPSCEHVELHNRMIEAGKDKIYLNPSMITLYSDYFGLPV